MGRFYITLACCTLITMCKAAVDPPSEGPKITTLSAQPDDMCGGVNCHNDVVQQTCANGKCRCKEGYKGCPGLCCYDETTEDCGVILNDPTVKTFDQERIDLPFPCRYLVTSTNLRADPEYCRFVIHAFNGKDQGRFFVKGFDLAIQETLGTQMKVATFRVEGTAEDGVYTYKEYSEFGFKVDGAMSSTDIPYFSMNYDEDLNAVTFNNEICGLKIKFRAYDYAYGINQRFVPGLCVSVEKRNSLRTWADDEMPMVLSPNMKLSDIRVLGTTDEQSFFSRALNPAVAQLFPDRSPMCKFLVESEFPNIPKRAEFLEKCYWIMKGHKFVGRNDKSNAGHDILRLLLRCYRAVVSGQDCAGFSESLLFAKFPATQTIPELDNWKNGAYCNS